MSPILDVQGVSVHAGRKALLDGISLAAEPGEAIAVVGPNGAGKSTLLRVLSGEITPHAGRVTLKHRDLRQYGPRELSLHRAVLAQHVPVAFPFTVVEVVRMGAGDRRSRDTQRLVDAALADVDLEAFRDRIITTLSGGEQQRAHFARVLVQLACGEAAHGPGLLLLDEPTASLDLRHQIDLLTVARQCMARGVTVIAILHDLNLAALFAQRVVVLHGGRIAGDGAPAETITDEMLERVFGVGKGVGRAPAPGAPFVLPQMLSREPTSDQARS